MSNIMFPSSPLTGDEFSHGNFTYRWDGVKWAVLTGDNTGYALKSELSEVGRTGAYNDLLMRPPFGNMGHRNLMVDMEQPTSSAHGDIWLKVT